MKKYAFSLLLGIHIVYAHAQSNVTLYGLIDEGIRYTSNAGGHSQWAMSAGNLQGDRWGLLGAEDLGGGAKAVFRLENGFNVNTGAFAQGGAEFGRQAYVGLSGHYGTLLFGRQYDVFADTGVAGLTFGNSTYLGGFGQMAGAAGVHPGDIDNLDNTNRINNAIKYVSQTYGGVKFAAEYGLGGVAGDFTQRQIWSLGASYYRDNLFVGAAYESIRNPNFSFYGNLPSSSTTSNNITTPVYRGYASAGTQNIFAGGGAYRFGKLAIGMLYSHVEFKNLGTEAALNPSHLSGGAYFNIGEINMGYTLTPAWVVGASFAYTRASSIAGHEGARYQQVDVSTDYALSKRTDLYLVGVYQHAGGDDSTLTPAVASITGFTPSTGRSQIGVMSGIRTRF
jgi:predicted porin